VFFFFFERNNKNNKRNATLKRLKQLQIKLIHDTEYPR